STQTGRGGRPRWLGGGIAGRGSPESARWRPCERLYQKGFRVGLGTQALGNEVFAKALEQAFAGETFAAAAAFTLRTGGLFTRAPLPGCERRASVGCLKGFGRIYKQVPGGQGEQDYQSCLFDRSAGSLHFHLLRDVRNGLDAPYEFTCAFRRVVEQVRESPVLDENKPQVHRREGG